MDKLAPASPMSHFSFANPSWRLAILFAGVVGGLAVVVAISSSLLLPVFSFDVPAGPYDIGTVTYHWVDESHSEVFSSDTKARREMMVQIWYPA